MFNLNYKCVPFAVAFLFVITLKGFTQSMTITSSNTSFTISSSSQVLNPATNTSAFSLNINSGGRAYSLSAKVINKVYNPSSAPFTSIPLTITLRGITGVTTTGGVTGNIQLLENPSFSTLATSATKTGTKATAIWTYDLTLASLGFTIPPGTYTYTVQVTYTDGTNTFTPTFNVTVNVQSVVNLSLVQNSSTTLTFGSSSAYTNGITSLNFHSLQVQTNMSWLVSVTAPQYFSAGGGGASTNMPSSIMAIRRNGTSTFMPLSTSAQTLATGSAGGASGANTTSYDMQFNPGYNYNPGIYNISLTYTLTGQ